MVRMVQSALPPCTLSLEVERDVFPPLDRKTKTPPGRAGRGEGEAPGEVALGNLEAELRAQGDGVEVLSDLAA